MNEGPRKPVVDTGDEPSAASVPDRMALNFASNPYLRVELPRIGNRRLSDLLWQAMKAERVGEVAITKDELASVLRELQVLRGQ